MYNALQQFHLPKLDEVGVVRYDADRGTVEATDELSNLRAYLDASRRSHRWCSRSLVLGSGLAGAVAVLVAIWSVGLLAGVALAELIGTAVVVALATHRAADSPGASDPGPTETGD